MSTNPFLSFRGAKYPQGVRRIRKAAELPTAAQHPQGVRRIRKAAKLPTAAQPVTEGFRTPVVPLV